MAENNVLGALLVLLHLVPATGSSWVNYGDIGYVLFPVYSSRHVNTLQYRCHYFLACYSLCTLTQRFLLHAYLCARVYSTSSLYGTWYLYIYIVYVYRGLVATHLLYTYG